MLSEITWGSVDGQCSWIARYLGDDEYFYYAIKDNATVEKISEYHVDPEGNILAEEVGSFEFDPRARPWFVAPQKAGQASLERALSVGRRRRKRIHFGDCLWLALLQQSRRFTRGNGC